MSDQDQAAAIQQEIARRVRGGCEWSAERMLLSGEAATCVEVSADLIDWCDACLLRAAGASAPRGQAVIDAVLYALREGCFFPVPELKPGATTQELTPVGRHAQPAHRDP